MPPPLRALQEAVLSWATGVRRDLPWRATRDPWAVLVSELMLQQTQVARVVPRYQSFLARFPTPEACAAASLGDVVRAWEGLGYNRRAVHLHAAAVEIVERFAGCLPTTLDELRGLPGVGPYTARAVLAFAHGADVGVVDTNAARVLSRAVAGRCLRPGEAQALADASVPRGQGWAWNQAVLDLGATVCRRRAPRCRACPLAATACAWAATAHALPDPADGSAGVGRRQSAFAGSDRQGRGRLVDALRRQGPVGEDDLATACAWPDEPERARQVAEGLVADGLAVTENGCLRLP